MSNRRSGSLATVDRPAAAGAAPDPGTATRILDVAERLVQDRGFNGFSYADVAVELSLTKPALHYHFANKADLGCAIIERHTTRFAAALAELDATRAGAADRLDGYAGLFLQALRDGRMCLCGMLASEYTTLPEPMRASVLSFFDDNEIWLEQVLEQGRADQSLRFDGSALDTARLIISTLEGAMLVARPYGDVARFQAVASNLLRGLRTADRLA